MHKTIQEKTIKLHKQVHWVKCTWMQTSRQSSVNKQFVHAKKEKSNGQNLVSGQVFPQIESIAEVFTLNKFTEGCNTLIT